MGLFALKTEDLPHYTYDDYARWEGKWELIEGIPYAMVPAPAMRHQRLSMKIAFQLDNLLENCGNCQTYQAIDWQITEDTVVQPDVLIVCGEYTEGEKLLIPPVLVVEILSPSTARKDKILKYQLYENAGVKYYCLVHPENKCAEVFYLGKKKYKGLGEYRDGRIPLDLGPCTINFDFSLIFQE